MINVSKQNEKKLSESKAGENMNTTTNYNSNNRNTDTSREDYSINTTEIPVVDSADSDADIPSEHIKNDNSERPL